MPYLQRFFQSVAVVFVLFFCLCALQPAKVSARKRCPVVIPDSLLTLYLKSDSIVVASLEGERFIKTIEEYDHGSTFETEKKLQIFQTLKGRDAASATFRETGFKSKKFEEVDQNSDEIDPPVGDKALFFLTRDEDDFYRLADRGSAIKRLDAAELNIYVKRIAELKRITNAKKNQLEKLTDWLVRLAEEPVTRDEGTIDLEASFRALEYERESEELKAPIKEAIVLDKNFRAENTSVIAKLLTDAQRERLANALLLSINSDLIKLDDVKSEDEITPDFQLLNLVGNWNKTSLAMTAFAFLQNAGDSNRLKTIYLLDVITNILEDDELYVISSEYQAALAEDENALTEFSEEEEEEAFEPETISSESETPVETENSAESNQVELIAKEIAAESDAPKAEETTDEPAVKITYKEYREKLLAKFIGRYGVAISQISDAK